MTYIWFNVREAYNQLLLSGYVYTLRLYSKFPPVCLAKSSLHGKPIDIGRVTVEKVCDINEENKDKLSTYVNGSGFKTITNWWDTATNAHRSTSLHLYLVKVK